jgi:hypothetical protein
VTRTVQLCCSSESRHELDIVACAIRRARDLSCTTSEVSELFNSRPLSGGSIFQSFDSVSLDEHRCLASVSVSYCVCGYSRRKPDSCRPAAITHIALCLLLDCRRRSERIPSAVRNRASV